MSLFGSHIHLELTPERTTYVLGEIVNVRARLTVAREVDIRSSRIELVAQARYKYRESARSSSGSTYRAVRTGSAEDVAGRETLVEPGTLAAGSVTDRQFSFALPVTSAPSGKGKLIAVVWRARAALDVVNGRDVTEETELTVLSPKEAESDRAEAPLEPGYGSHDCEIDVKADRRDVRAGETVTGALRVTAPTALDAKEVKIELVQREEVEVADGRTADTVVARAVLAGDAHLEPEQAQTFPFSLTVPPDACPGMEREAFSVYWLLRGAIDRRLRFDYEVFLPLNVYNAETSPDAVTA